MMNKLKILVVVLFLAVSLLGCDSERYDAEEKFAKVQKNLMASVNDLTSIPPKVELAAEPYINGKIAVFQVLEKKDWDKSEDTSYFMTILYFREMEEIYAAAPEEVGTVALLDCQTLEKGVYQTDDGREYPAEVEDCEMTMIDRSKQTVISKRKFEKNPSEERRAYGNSMVRQSAQEDILQFLKSLPKR